MHRIFEPLSDDRSLKTDYPELSDVDEFRDLSAKEMLLVWYFANKTSPFAAIKSVRTRMEKSIERVYKNNALSQENRSALLTGVYPTKLKTAFDRMAKYDANVRSQANSMIQRIFDNYSNIVSLRRDEIQELDDEQKAAYVNTASKVAKDLPDLVRQLESGYGIRERKDDGDHENIMDSLINDE